jgi:hypothetical protein
LVQWPDDVVLDVRFVGPNAEALSGHRDEIQFVLETFKYYGLKQK